MTRNRALNIAANICCFVLAVVFLFSGFVKSVDPWGTAIKVNEYLHSFGWDWAAGYHFGLAILLCGAELMLGAMMLLRVFRPLVSLLTLLAMSGFTLVTFYIAFWGTVEDCGCFGDALKLTPWQTFLKNLFIMPLVVVVWMHHRHQRVLAFRRWEIVFTGVFCTLAMGLGAYCYYHLPLIDFLPYKVSANIYEMIEEQHDTGHDAMSSEEYVLIYRNRRTGRLREFNIDDTEWQNEEKWEWVETRVDNESSPIQTLVSEFAITDSEGDATQEILTHAGEMYLICVTSFDKLSDKCINNLMSVVDIARSRGGSVVCITPQPLREVTYRSFGDSEPVRCYNIDATVMKTMLRAESGVVVLRDGVIAGKYNCRNIDLD